MAEEHNLVSVKLSKKAMQELEVLKIHPRQPLYEVVEFLIEKHNEKFGR